MNKSFIQLAVSVLGIFGSVVPSLPAQALSLQEATDQAFRKNGIERVSMLSEVTPRNIGSKSYAFKPVHVVPQGNGYVIVTDQIDPVALQSLNKLAQFHSGSVIRLNDFRNLYKMPSARAHLIERLRQANPKYVAFAPKLETLSENGLLAIWQLLLNYGNGQLNVYPGFLMAEDSTVLSQLVDRAINCQPMQISDVRPVVVSQFTDPKSGGMRSVQKAKVMEDLFEELNINCPGLVVRTNTAPPDPAVFPKIGSLGTVQQKQNLVRQLPPEAAKAIGASNFLLMFGHGSTGMSCSLDVDAYRDVPMKNDIVLCGSCFSCTPFVSDILQKNNGRRREPLIYRAIANGAQVFWGHMHENSGFPELFVAFESLMKGEQVGRAYQETMNGIFANTRLQPQQFVMSEQELGDEDAVKQRNHVLFVMVGDPAAQPIAR